MDERTGFFVKRNALKAAFPPTVPVLTGYLFLGVAYGILMTTHNVPVLYTVLMSLIVYSGSMQYLAVTLFCAHYNPWYALILTLAVNARHLFYGIAMLPRFRALGCKKWYLIFAMTDETFSLHVGKRAPEGVDEGWYMFFVTLLDHSYWVLASAIGALLGLLVRFDVTGLDFVLTALFVVIFVEQWEQTKNHLPALIGVGCAVVCLVLLGPDNFLIPAMAAILLCLVIFRPLICRGEEGAQ